MSARAWLPVALLLAVVACDNRACLAQSDLFAGYREELIDECCLCLARRGTAKPGASCGEASLEVDGGVSVGPGPSVPGDPDDVFLGDDLDDVIQEPVDGGPGEIPCLCGQSAATCIDALTAGRSLVITGACIYQGAGLFETAPCELECRDVLTFDPLPQASDG